MRIYEAHLNVKFQHKHLKSPLQSTHCSDVREWIFASPPVSDLQLSGLCSDTAQIVLRHSYWISMLTDVVVEALSYWIMVYKSLMC